VIYCKQHNFLIFIINYTWKVVCVEKEENVYIQIYYIKLVVSSWIVSKVKIILHTLFFCRINQIYEEKGLSA